MKGKSLEKSALTDHERINPYPANVENMVSF